VEKREGKEKSRVVCGLEFIYNFSTNSGKKGIKKGRERGRVGRRCFPYRGLSLSTTQLIIITIDYRPAVWKRKEGREGKGERRGTSPS